MIREIKLASGVEQKIKNGGGKNFVAATPPQIEFAPHLLGAHDLFAPPHLKLSNEIAHKLIKQPDNTFKCKYLSTIQSQNHCLSLITRDSQCM